MKLYNVCDTEFSAYGKVLEGYDTAPILEVLGTKTPMSEGVEYVASEAALERLPAMQQLHDNAYGGMPIQMGWCNGYNTKLNCLEYHRDSEVNVGTEDFILLLAKQDEIVQGQLDTSKVKAFLCPAGVLIEVYATSLHYAPCSVHVKKGFRVLVVLPKGTNTDRPALSALNLEDKMLWARNKWLLAHKDTTEAAAGAHVGLVGENIDVALMVQG